MNNREVLDFLRAVDGTRAATGMCEGYCIAIVADILGVPIPSPAMLKNMRLHRAGVTRKRSRGKPLAGGVTKGEAVASLATYFESVGARPEQAIRLAHAYLGSGFKVSRKVAKAAIAKYRAATSPDQYRIQAEFVYLEMSPRARASRLPTEVEPIPRKRSVKA